jgi:restriction endonuclease Mrr
VDEYLRSVQQRVVTINGDQLVELMLQNGVGTRLQSTYELFKIDDDFFND